MTATGLITTALTTTGSATPTGGPSAGEGAGAPTRSFATTGTAIEWQLLLAGMTITVGGLLVRLSPGRRRRSAAAA